MSARRGAAALRALAGALAGALACDPSAGAAPPAAASVTPVAASAPGEPQAPAPAAPPAPAPAQVPAAPPAPAPAQVPIAPPPVATAPAPNPPPSASEVPVQRAGVVSELKADEELRLLPVVAYRDGDGWRVTVRAWVFEPEEGAWFRGAAIEGLVGALGLPEGAGASEVFRRRARAFLVDNERGKRVVVQIGRKEHVLEATGANGHSETALHLDDADLPAPMNTFTAVLAPGDARTFAGTIVRLDAGGVSVVSDVDDTVKISEVRDKKKLLANTFLREFEPVSGMAALYGRWQAQGAAFHYLSASPWQLHDALAGFFTAGGFPAGSLHLKLFRAKDSSFASLFMDPKSYKAPLLQALIGGAPGRRFVLVGDSGELDPEAYADAYRAYPDQIAAIYIRDVSDEGRDAPRYRTTFSGVPPERWQIFRDPAEVSPQLP